MRDHRKIQETWAACCEALGITLNHRQRNYFYGRTIVYEAREQVGDMSLHYYHRYEMPDTGVRPEALVIEVRGASPAFRVLKTKRRGLAWWLFGRDVFVLTAGASLEESLRQKITFFYQNFPLAALETKVDRLQVRLYDFPASAEDFMVLRNFVLNLLKYLSAAGL